MLRRCRTVESLDRILEVLRTKTHNGFPVFADEDSEEDGISEVPSSRALLETGHSTSVAGGLAHSPPRAVYTYHSGAQKREMGPHSVT